MNPQNHKTNNIILNILRCKTVSDQCDDDLITAVKILFQNAVSKKSKALGFTHFYKEDLLSIIVKIAKEQRIGLLQTLVQICKRERGSTQLLKEICRFIDLNQSKVQFSENGSKKMAKAKTRTGDGEKKVSAQEPPKQTMLSSVAILFVLRSIIQGYGTLLQLKLPFTCLQAFKEHRGAFQLSKYECDVLDKVIESGHMPPLWSESTNESDEKAALAPVSTLCD